MLAFSNIFDQPRGVHWRSPVETEVKPKKQKKPTNDLFLQRLVTLLDQRQALYHLSHVLDWEQLERDFESLYAERGRPAKPIRLWLNCCF